MTLRKALHLRDNIDKLYESRKEIARELASIEDSVDASIKGFKYYVKKSKERLITAAGNSINNIQTNRTTKTRKQKWEENQMNGYFKQQTGEIANEKTWKGCYIIKGWFLISIIFH